MDERDLCRLLVARGIVAPDHLTWLLRARAPGRGLAQELVARGLVPPAVLAALLAEARGAAPSQPHEDALTTRLTPPPSVPVPTSTPAGAPRGALLPQPHEDALTTRITAPPGAPVPTSTPAGEPRGAPLPQAHEDALTTRAAPGPGTPAATPAGARGRLASLEPGDVLAGRFAIDAKLGQGGMGVVLRGRDLALGGAAVAIKVLLPDVADHAALARFEREVELAARVSAEGVVRIRTAGVDGGRPYCVMDLVEGDDLGRVFAAGPLQRDRLARLMETIARTLEACHGAGVLHRDLKPANVLVRAHDDHPLVADFGLARAADLERLTRTGQMLGTPAYMAPEQADGLAVDARADVYGLGAILYHGLSGQAPFRGSAMEVLKGVLMDEPVLPSRVRTGVDRDLEAVCRVAMAKAPEDRYPSAGALADDLARARAGEPVRARPLGALARWRRRLARRDPRALALAAAALVVVALALLGGSQVRRAWIDARARTEASAALGAARALDRELLEPLAFGVDPETGRSSLPPQPRRGDLARAARAGRARLAAAAPHLPSPADRSEAAALVERLAAHARWLDAEAEPAALTGAHGLLLRALELAEAQPEQALGLLDEALSGGVALPGAGALRARLWAGRVVQVVATSPVEAWRALGDELEAWLGALAPSDRPARAAPVAAALADAHERTLLEVLEREPSDTEARLRTLAALHTLVAADGATTLMTRKRAALPRAVAGVAQELARGLQRPEAEEIAAAIDRAGAWLSALADTPPRLTRREVEALRQPAVAALLGAAGWTPQELLTGGLMELVGPGDGPSSLVREEVAFGLLRLGLPLHDQLLARAITSERLKDRGGRDAAAAAFVGLIRGREGLKDAHGELSRAPRDELERLVGLAREATAEGGRLGHVHRCRALHERADLLWLLQGRAEGDARARLLAETRRVAAALRAAGTDDPEWQRHGHVRGARAAAALGAEDDARALWEDGRAALEALVPEGGAAAREELGRFLLAHAGALAAEPGGAVRARELADEAAELLPGRRSRGGAQALIVEALLEAGELDQAAEAFLGALPGALAHGGFVDAGVALVDRLAAVDAPTAAALLARVAQALRAVVPPRSRDRRALRRLEEALERAGV
ncbi:MAG: protein kinase [Planctomycetes bacterium]|nr:protein kinase [Planctomycetota bacterium]